MNKAVLLVIIIFPLILGCQQPSHPAVTPTPEQAAQTQFQLEFGVKYQVKVVKVVDGDTIDVLMPDGSVERIRILGIDCPEPDVDMNKPNEYDAIADLDYLAYWGKIAADYARQKLEGRMVEIELDELAGKRGYYGRILAYVYVDGADFGAEMIKKGYARTYVEGEFRKELEYTTLEEKAKSAGVGLWAAMQ